jgi:hypothetical protein
MLAEAWIVNVVLDLDGTILFPEATGIAIPGRSRPAFLSATVAKHLAIISRRCNLYIATARHAINVKRLADQLADVRFAGFSLECGFDSRTYLDDTSPDIDPDLTHIAAALCSKLSGWERLEGYKKIICLVAPTTCREPLETIRQVLHAHEVDQNWQVHQELRKLFLFPQMPCKVRGLNRIGVEAIDIAAGDDWFYDRSLLSSATFPLTLSSSDYRLRSLVISRSGMVVSGIGHVAAEQMLREISRRIQ